MLKIIGTFLVLAAGGGAGLIYAMSCSRHPGELRAILSALQLLETEINYTATPLAEALGKVAARSDKSVAPLFYTAAELLGQNTGRHAGEAWQMALDKFYPGSNLSPRDYAILLNLGWALGISDCRDQRKHLQLASEQIKLELSRAVEAARKNVKMWAYLGIGGSMALVLVVY